MNRSILIIAAHADDEALGCSGTIFRHVDNGDSVHLLLMTDGVSSRYVAGDEIQVRLNSLQDAAEAMGISTFKTLSFPDNKMDSIPLLEIIKEIEKAIMNLQPEVIYTHHIGDLNVDHQVTHKAVITACRPQPDFCVKEIYAFEVLSSTEWQTPGYLPFNPNMYIDITEKIGLKRKVLELYKNEMNSPPHSRSVKNAIHLNAIRGNSIGVKYAEAFVLIRAIR